MAVQAVLLETQETPEAREIPALLAQMVIPELLEIREVGLLLATPEVVRQIRGQVLLVIPVLPGQILRLQ